MSSSRDSRAMAAFCAEERCCQRINITGIALMYSEGGTEVFSRVNMLHW